MEIIWILLILSAFQPLIRQKLLESSRQQMIRKIEAANNSRVILLVHRQETFGFLGFPMLRFISIEDSEEVLRAISMTDSSVPLDIVLHTPGGLVLASVQIANAIRKHPGKVRVFVPHYAMSGGTLIALAADEIVMSEHAVLGPVDPQIGEFPAASILQVLEAKEAADIDDATIMLADQASKAISQVREVVKRLLESHLDEGKAEDVANILTEGTWTHDYPITFEIAQRLGLPVSDALPKEIMQLLALYPQPVRQSSSVEYLPTPHRSTPPRR